MSSYLEMKKKALLMSAGGWWIPNNFDPSNCICAFKFTGAANQAESLTSLTGNYDLTINGTAGTYAWASNVGWKLGNGSLTNTDICAIAYHSNTNVKAVIIRTNDGTNGPITFPNTSLGLYRNGNNGPICSMVADGAVIRLWNSNNTNGSIIGRNLSQPTKVYIDGVARTCNDSSTIAMPLTYLFPGNGASDINSGNVFIAGVFYSAELTQTQMIEVEDRMRYL